MEIISAITGVFNSVADWFVEVLPDVLSLFYTAGTDGGAGSLTVLGALTIFGLGISVVMLVLNMVKDFLRFR